MEEYINKTALVAEIEKELNSCNLILMGNDYINVYEKGREDVCHKILSFLDTLEMKEVDLEKEIIDWWNTHYSEKDYSFKGYVGHYLENSTIIELAKHFFELGLKAQKGE